MQTRNSSATLLSMFPKTFSCYTTLILTKGDLMGRKRNETMRGIRGKSMFMTNLAITVDVYSTSTLMTLLFDAIVEKYPT